MLRSTHKTFILLSALAFAPACASNRADTANPDATKHPPEQGDGHGSPGVTGTAGSANAGPGGGLTGGPEGSGSTGGAGSPGGSLPGDPGGPTSGATGTSPPAAMTTPPGTTPQPQIPPTPANAPKG